MLEDVISPNFSKGPDIPSGSRNLNQTTEEQYDPSQDRSPTRSLSEDRLHVSLRLGPLYPVSEDGTATIETRRGAKAGKATTSKPSASRKRTGRTEKVSRSPAQGVSVKRRRVTKGQNSPKRRTPVDPKKSTAGTATSSKAQPTIKLIPASRKKGMDFRSGPPPLP